MHIQEQSREKLQHAKLHITKKFENKTYLYEELNNAEEA